MADVLLNIVIEGVLNKLISLAAEEISKVWGVKEDLDSLAGNLEMIQALLVDAECKHNSSNAVDLWLRRLQDVSSEAEYLLDEFAYEVLRNKLKKRKQDQVRSFFSCSCPLAFRFKFAHKIKNMNLRIEKVYQEAERIGLRSVEIGNMSNNPRSDRSSTAYPFVDDSSIVGRSEEVNEVVNLLTSSEKDGNNLSVIGIVGMAGLGKTTIAQLVYKNEKVLRHFDHKLWIHVSEDFNVERLLNNMVESLTGTNSNLTVVEAIVRKLNEVLKTKRFLLVLDDVWDEVAKKWDGMRKCLRGIGASDESRIIVTTRNETVVSIMQPSFLCPLGTLSDGDSWELFEKIAFGHGCAAVKTPELINIGRKIVAKCGGVPLAVAAIGGLLWYKKDEREWSKIENNKTMAAMEEAGRRVISAIKLSYDHLPSLSLKQCLLYCTIVGKGGVATVESMIQLWMAQGLLNPSKGSDLEMEDVGSNYMSILFRTSLLQVSEEDGFGRAIKFTIHDLVFDFVEEAAKESIFLVPSAELRTGRESLLKPRTLILKDGLAHHLPIVRNHKSLRVLRVDDEDVKELPTMIGKLKLLRYLDISRMYNLQTMKLSNLQQLPKNFGNLANLRHLCIGEDGIINGKPCLLPDIGQLSSLQTLPFFYVSQDKGCQIDQLGRLPNLRGDLKIFDLQNVSNEEEAIKAKISTKINLDSLELHWDTRTRDESTDEDVLKGLEPHPNLKGFTMENFMGRSLPSWMLTTSHPLVFRNLEKIVLRNFNKCQEIPPLGHLPHLNIVNIIGMKSLNCIGTDFFGWKNVDDASSSNPSGLAGDAVVSFPALKELILEYMPDLIEWSGLMCHDSSHSVVKIFPSLEILKVELCPKLVSLPDGVWQNLICIKELCISGCLRLSHLPKDVGGLASLEILTVMYCPNLVSIPDIHSLRSLVRLTLAFCNNLRSLPSGMEVCTSIRRFVFLGCPAIQPEDLHPLSRMIQLQGLMIGGFSHDLDYFPWPSYTINPCRVTITDNENKEFQHPFASLLYLGLWGWQAVTSLPEQIRHLSNLVFLQILHFDGIVALPEFLGSIHSLEELDIADCQNLLYLPSAEAMRRLNKFRKLTIKKCPLLKDRCKKEIGQEWYKIAHIPEIQLLP
ncbi:disease resistance protein RGA2-like [Coffea arabica]|uniref:Disease resistance protein RGA2-like n=1 Tax=Coffea arabica TaxID=13443 RepID=A0A6P6WXJ6_COFAR|nr:disease resistance protein RGA2-like [Coffea arabica]XP_027120165.1 disease resistance protein RGA2-like [Coffea arabica]